MNTWADESYKIYFLAKPVKIVAPDAVFADLLRVRSDIKIMLKSSTHPKTIDFS